MNRRICLPALLVALAGSASAAWSQTEWVNDLGGLWGNAANWVPQDVPDSPTESALIEMDGTYVVLINFSPSINELTIHNPNATVQIGASHRLTLSGTLHNDGMIVVNPEDWGYSTELMFSDDSSIVGSGVMVLNSEDWRSSMTTAAGITIVNGEQHTIRGRGRIYAGLINVGTIVSDVSGQTMMLTDAPKTNISTIKATNGGHLLISDTTVTQSGDGVVLADSGSVRLHNTGVLEGELVSANGGYLQITGVTTLTNVLSNADLRLQAGHQAIVYGTHLTNNGTITVNPEDWGYFTSLHYPQSATLGGTGVVNLNSGDWTASITSEAGATITQTAGHTIRGRGRVYASLDNLGLISADVGGQQMIFSDGAKSNSGTIESTNGAHLLVTGTSIAQSASGLVLADGGSVQFDNAGLAGGLLHSTDGGFVQITGTSTLTDVQSSADLRVQASHGVRIGGTNLTNHGTIIINPEQWGYFTALHAPSNATLTGTGVVNLNSGNWTASITTGDGATLTHGAGHTVRGMGRVYASLDNQGTISADVPGQQMIFSEAPKSNSGLIGSTNGAGLLVTGTTIAQSAAGVVRADGGGVQFDSAVLSGGSLESANGGTVHVTGVSTFEDVVSNAEMYVQAGHSGRIDGTHLTNNGVIVINPEEWGYFTSLHALSNCTIDGAGTVLLHSNDWLSSLTVAGGATLVIGPEQTVKGIGRLDGSFVFDGRLAPGRSVGTIGQVAGTTVFGPSGRLDIEIESASGADRFDAWGASVTLGGTLEVKTLGDYTPALGDSFVVVTAPTIVGAFANVQQTGLAAR